MAFLEVQFPPDISRGVTGGPKFATTVIRNDAGFRAATIVRQYPLHEYDATKIIRDQASFDVVKSFFLAARGRANGFRFKDWTDYRCSSAVGAFEEIASGVRLLVKAYPIETPYDGTLILYRRIQKPVDGSVTISGPSVYTLDPRTGIVTYSGDPPTSWEGQFDVPVAFGADAMNVQLMERSVIASWSSIKFEEIPLRVEGYE